MTALFAYRRLSPVQALACGTVLLVAVMTAPARAADTIMVAVDQATITRMPDNVSTLVIGNPLIADVTVQPGGILVVTGKGFGMTNLIALDRSGAVLAERNIQVIGAQDQVVYVYRGVNRETYSCEPECEPRITLGDSAQYFGDTLTQAGNRATRAQGQAAANAAPR
jgi:Pilus formation protein N terminal region